MKYLNIPYYWCWNDDPDYNSDPNGDDDETHYIMLDEQFWSEENDDE